MPWAALNGRSQGHSRGAGSHDARLPKCRPRFRALAFFSSAFLALALAFCFPFSFFLSPAYLKAEKRKSGAAVGLRAVKRDHRTGSQQVFLPLPLRIPLSPWPSPRKLAGSNRDKHEASKNQN